MAIVRRSMSFSLEEVLELLDALEGRHTHLLTNEELKIHDKLIKRLEKAQSKLEDIHIQLATS